MSFVTAIRDYVEILNNLSNSFTTTIPVKEFFVESLLYLVKSGQYILTWLFTFQWIHDFTLLPIIIPQNMASVLRETFVLENSTNVIFGFLELPTLHQNLFLLGIFNSFFLTLPISVLHIITIRRLFIKGIPTATISIAGYLFGQWFFIACVIFGLRFIIIPWLTLEPLNYFIGLILIFRLVYSMTQENLREITGWRHTEYINIFLTSLLLSWCEQTSIFQYLSNITLAPTTSLMESLYSINLANTIFSHFNYLFGIIFGSILFTGVWGFILLQVKNLFIRYTPLFLSSFIQTINTGSFILAIGFSLSSIPFYGLDYLTTNPLGFVSQDKVFKNTIFDQYNIKDSVLGLGISSQFDTLDIDITPFDRGRYLIFPERTMPFDFEDINYRGEAEWTTRYDKVSTVTDSRAGFLSLAKLFKKQKPDENVAITRSQNDDQKILPIKSKFGLANSNSQNIALESKSSRFEDWYSTDSNQSNDDSRPLESIFAELQDTTFPLDFIRTTSVEPENLDLKLKQKYYSNPIYKNLLTADIDLFLNRHDSKFKLNSTDELDLYNKRRILTAYYDSLRDYSKLPYVVDFDNFFEGSKSFTNKVYNQQFKGTLRSLCRLFSLTIDPEASLDESSTGAAAKVLKFDQPLYTFAKDKKYSAYHEELNPSKIISKKDSLPFLQDQNGTPLYGGWDENLRKFVITNKFLSREIAGYNVQVPNEVKNKFNSKSNKKSLTELDKVKFTVWPVQRKKLSEDSSNLFNTLYISQNKFEAPGDPRFDTLSTLPANWETRNRRSNIGLGQTYDNIFDYLAPERGGFVWPTTKTPILNFSK